MSEQKTSILIGSLLLIVALFQRMWRFSSAPGIYVDEAFYTHVAVNLSVYGQLMAFEEPWFVHPPLYFLIQGIFFKLIGITDVTLTNVFLARLPTCLWSSLTIIMVFIWVTKASNYKIGAISALLLASEQYSLNFGRTGILEPLTILLNVTFLYFFWKATGSGNFKSYVLAGIFLGMSLITKELSFYVSFFIIVWWFLNKHLLKIKINIRKLLYLVGTALLIYLGYVIWGLKVNATYFLGSRISLIKRIIWIFRDTNYTHPRYGIFINNLVRTGNIYIMSYIILGLAPVFCIYLIFRNKTRTSIFLSSWFISSAIFFGLIGTQNAKFFVHVTVPAVVVVGYTLSKSLFNHASWQAVLKPRNLAIYILLLTFISYNSVVCYSLYNVETDNALRQSIEWIKANVPSGSKIVAAYFYKFFLKDYEIFDISPCWSNITLYNIKGLHIHYFITSPHWNHEIDTDTLEYITTNGEAIASFYGHWTQEIVIYYIKGCD